MKEVYIGIDTHKETNALALAFSGREAPVFYVQKWVRNGVRKWGQSA